MKNVILSKDLLNKSSKRRSESSRKLDLGFGNKFSMKDGHRSVAVRR